MAYKGYGEGFGNIFEMGPEGGHPYRELVDPNFGILGPSNFGNTKIKTRKCADGSLPPCDEDVITSGGCAYGKCPDGSCKDSFGNCKETKPEVCKWGKYADGTCKPEPKTCIYGKDALGNCISPHDPYDWDTIKDLDKLTGPELIDPRDWRGPEAQWGTTEGQRIGRGSEVQRFGGLRPVGLTQDQQDKIDTATENYKAGILSPLSGTLGYTGETGNDFSQFDSIADAGRQFLDLGGEEFDFDRAIASSDPMGSMSDVRTGEALETLRLQEQEELNAQNMVDSFSILDVRETYKKAEDELDNMSEDGILSAAEVTTAKQNLHEEEDDVVEEIVKKTGARTGGDDRDDRDDEKKPDKPKKTRQPPHKTKTTKTKTKTKTKTSTAASRASVTAVAAAMSKVSGASKAHKTRMSRVVDPWAFEDKRGGRR